MESGRWFIDINQVRDRAAFILVLQEFRTYHLYEWREQEGTDKLLGKGRCPFCLAGDIEVVIVENHFLCFNCRKEGDIVDFIAAARGISKELARKVLFTILPEGKLDGEFVRLDAANAQGVEAFLDYVSGETPRDELDDAIEGAYRFLVKIGAVLEKVA